MSEVWPIFVPSYGRAGKSHTLGWLSQYPDLDVGICVEAEDADAYRFEYPWAKLLLNHVKPHSIVGARQSILKYAREKGIPWYWQIDDTVMSIASRFNPKDRIVKENCGDSVEALRNMQYFAKLNPRIALVSPDFRHLGWREEKQFSMNTRCMVVTGTRTDTGVDYDLNLIMKEDLDYCLALMSNGWSTFLSHINELNEVIMGANKTGGMVEKYASPGFHDIACRQMVKKWPGICTLTHRNGRPEVKISWKKFSLGASKQKKETVQ